MDFFEIVPNFESLLASKKIEFQVLEVSYLGYAFGSGSKVFRIKGTNLDLSFDGRDKQITVSVTKPHEKYPSKEWATIFNGSLDNFLKDGAIGVISSTF